jgi:hypothetical protein
MISITENNLNKKLRVLYYAQNVLVGATSNTAIYKIKLADNEILTHIESNHVISESGTNNDLSVFQFSTGVVITALNGATSLIQYYTPATAVNFGATIGTKSFIPLFIKGISRGGEITISITVFHNKPVTNIAYITNLYFYVETI